MAGHRREQLTGEIASSYSPLVHLIVVHAIASLGIAVPLVLLRDVKPWEWASVPLLFAFMNVFEWAVHRGPMHHKWKGLGRLWERHTVVHHGFFHHDDLAIRDPRELVYVLFPPWVTLLFLVFVAPVPALLWLVGLHNLAALFLCCSFSYYLVYEWFHLLHHLPEKGWAGSPLAQKIRLHHRNHHRPETMVSGNFNVSFPFADWLLGTWLKDK